jgi:cyclic 2,3-diphosphoglycerate synthetase
VGCRRCGGGLAGQVSSSNVAEGARIAAALEPELVIFDGSGAALPPIAVDRRIVVVGGHQEPALATGYLNAYRLLLADLVLVTMAEARTEWQRVRTAASAIARPSVAVVGAVLRPRPMEPVAGKTVAYFSTAPATSHATLRTFLADEHGADVVHVSGALADRAALRRELETVDAAVYLVELKAAAIDLVAEAALARGAAVVLAANDLMAAAGEPDLDELLLEMAKLES